MVALLLPQGENLFENGDLAAGLASWGAPAGAAVLPAEAPVAKAVRVTIPQGNGGPAWDLALTQKPNAALVAGQPLRLAFWARSATRNRLAAFLQEAQDPYGDSFREELTLAPEWREYAVEGLAARALKPGEWQAGFHLNYGPGTVEIGNVRLFRAAAASQEPRPLLGEPAWRVGGNARLEDGRFVVTGPPGDAPYSSAASALSTEAVGAGEAVLFRASMRSPSRSRTNVAFEGAAPPNGKVFSQAVKLTPEWKEYRFAGVAPRGYAAGAAQLSVWLGYGAGTVEVKEVRVESLGRRSLQGLNLTVDPYGGEPNPESWRAPALARIEKMRKGDLVVHVVDAKGRPVKGADVRVDQIRHAFRFGTAAPAERIVRDAKFRGTIERLFNTVTFENDLKWNRLEDRRDENVEQAFVWAKSHGIAMRGHNLVWGSRRWLPAGLWDKGDAEVKDAIRARVASAVARYKGRVYLWDVVNEAVTEHDLWDRLGWDWFAETFRLARAADPKARLAYNDYDLTEEASAGPGHLTKAKALIQRLIDAKAPLDTIGIQAHVATPITPTKRVLEILDDLARYGKRLEITEYDLGVQDDAANGAHMRDFLTACFSHPSMDAFVMWGFWEGSHWRAAEGGAMFRRDWTSRPAALAYEDLVKRRWWTKARLKTDANGNARVRAFYGTQGVTVGGRTTKVELQKAAGKAKITVKI